VRGVFASARSYPFGSLERMQGCEKSVFYSLLIGIPPDSFPAVIIIEDEEKRL
jgi:hypothetical protein